MKILNDVLTLSLDSHHSKARLREFERIVRFGDTVQVSQGYVRIEKKSYSIS